VYQYSLYYHIVGTFDIPTGCLILIGNPLQLVVGYHKLLSFIGVCLLSDSQGEVMGQECYFSCVFREFSHSNMLLNNQLAKNLRMTYCF